MKKITTALLLCGVAFTIISIPAPEVHALSCIYFDATEAKRVQESGEYNIFVGKALENKEFGHHTGQYLEVTDPISGFIRSHEWVYFKKDETWGYWCAGQPAPIGEEALYIVDNSDFTGVNKVYISLPLEDNEASEYLLDNKRDTVVGSEFDQRVDMLYTSLKQLIQEITLIFSEISFFQKN